MSDSEPADKFRVLRLDALVRRKLTSFRDKDRTQLRDLISVGLATDEMLVPEVALGFLATENGAFQVDGRANRRRPSQTMNRLLRRNEALLSLRFNVGGVHPWHARVQRSRRTSPLEFGNRRTGSRTVCESSAEDPQGCRHSHPRGSGLVMLQGVSGAGFENCELIDSFQQTIELRHFRGPELMLSISGQELV